MPNKMQGTQVRDFTRGNITSQLITFAWPLFLSNLLQIVYNMVDMIIVGHVLGKVGTSAVSVGGDISAFLTFIAMGFSSAGQVLIAKRIGSRRQDTIGKFVATMTGFLFCIAIFLSITALLLQDVLLGLMNTPSASYQEAANYSAVCMVGLIFIYGYNIVSAVLRGMGDSRHPFIFIGIAAVVNVLLDILFVIIMDLGAGGAALATVISQAVSFVSCTIFLLCNKKQFCLNFKVRDLLFWDGSMLSELLKLGSPMAIKFASVQISKLFFNSWINSYSVEVSAFAGIANKISSISNLVSNAIFAQKQNGGGRIIIGSEQVGDRVKIYVKDNGPGISPTIRHRLFKEMVTNKGTQGSGLGLYISNTVVHGKFNGAMWCEDNPDGGAIFGMTIPLHIPENEGMDLSEHSEFHPIPSVN